jgi:hypothetical protein
MPEGTRDPETALRRAYFAGALLCVGLPLALQIGLPWIVPPGQNSSGEPLLQIGYTFTGLSVLTLALAARRLRKAQQASHSVEPVGWLRDPAREILSASVLLASCAAMGCLYWALGGPGVERHARTFLALTPVGFLLFVPRPSRWISRSGQSRA